MLTDVRIHKCICSYKMLSEQVANRFGGETSKGSIDVWLKNPEGKTLYTKEGVKEDTFTVNAKGSKGPWQLCFRISHAESPQQHALIIELSHFTLNLRALVGTDHEWTKGPTVVDVVCSLVLCVSMS